MVTQYTFRSLLILAGFGLFSALNAQNLVPNPSFEVQDTCPAVSQIQLASPWNSATMGTPDLFNSTCGAQNPQAHTGIGSAGVFCYSTFPDNREYLQVPLTQSLVAGQMYHVSFWVIRVNYKYAVSNIGAYFSNGAMSVQSTGVLPVTPQVVNPYSNVITGTTWSQIAGNFVASGGEDHLILGNFSNDAGTNLVTANASNANAVAFYRFDDVSVTSTMVGIEELRATSLIWGMAPSGDRAWVSVPDALDEAQPFSLYDLDGRMVPFTTERTGMDRYEIIPNTPVAGLFILRVRSGSGTRVAKMVFQPN